MPTAEEHSSSDFLKLIYIGDSGTGKTGSLASLVAAGYKLKFLDMDNGLDALVAHVRRDDPDKLKNIEYETRRDQYKATASGPVIKGVPKAYVDSLKLLEKWSDESDPSEWGPETIFVLDSLTSFGKAAFEWAKGMNPTAKDPRNWYFTAQSSVEDVLSWLTGEEFRCNVIIISHVQYKEIHDGTTRGYSTAIGSALGPIIPRYFNTLVLAEKSGQGKYIRRSVRTIPTSMIDLKTPAPWMVDDELPLESGMATLFEQLKTQEK